MTSRVFERKALSCLFLPNSLEYFFRNVAFKGYNVCFCRIHGVSRSMVMCRGLYVWWSGLERLHSSCLSSGSGVEFALCLLELSVPVAIAMRLHEL